MVRRGFSASALPIPQPNPTRSTTPTPAKASLLLLSLSVCLHTLSAPHSLSNMGPLRRKTCPIPSAKTTSINAHTAFHSVILTMTVLFGCSTFCITVLHPQSGSCFTTSSVYTNIPPATAVTTTTGAHQVSPPAVKRGSQSVFERTTLLI